MLQSDTRKMSLKREVVDHVLKELMTYLGGLTTDQCLQSHVAKCHKTFMAYGNGHMMSTHAIN